MGGAEGRQGDVEGAIRAVIAQGSLFEFDPKTAKQTFDTINLRKRPVRARTAEGDERQQLWDLMLEPWPEYAGYQAQTDREIPVVVLERR